MSVGQPPASAIAPYRSDAFAVAKNVSGCNVGSGSDERAVSSGGGGGGAAFFGFGGGGVATRPGGAATGAAGVAAGLALAGGVGLAVGTATGAEAAAPGCDGMDGLAGASGAGWGPSTDGLTTGEAFSAGAVVVCANATETARGAQMRTPIRLALNFIERLARPRALDGRARLSVWSTMLRLPKLYDDGFIATVVKLISQEQRRPAITRRAERPDDVGEDR